MSVPSIYVCDLDGTLLRADATLSDFSRDGLNRLIDAGVPLTVASARGTAGMRSLLTGVRLRFPVIELNGTFVSELDSGRHVVSNVLSKRDACAAPVLEATTEVVGSNDEDGIVRHMLERHLGSAV